ncbi:M3 family metallopeptidase [Longirhabdus pacifica]|uniref:M3 family metallopeptidase n=1 Tax=Longirhabdus pacifica TaxID=2305227 RepID=UPI001008ED88|nr:M3 family metallopeptidase [Longirhabdus pacifica]
MNYFHMDPHVHLEQINQQLQHVQRDFMHALWMVLTTGEMDWAYQCEQKEKAYQEVCIQIEHKDKAPMQQYFHQRQYAVLHRETLPFLTDENTRNAMSSLWNDLNYRFATFRPTINGNKATEQQLLTMLRQESDAQKREQMWNESMQIGKSVAPGLIKLVHMRNQVAQENGFSNFFEMKMHSQELEIDDVFQCIHTVKHDAAKYYEKVKDDIDTRITDQFSIQKENIRPWHYQHPFFQQDEEDPSQADVAAEVIVEHIVHTFSAFGIDLAPLLQQADVYERQGKSASSFCLHLDRAGDIRLATQMKPMLSNVSTFLHEIGHALYEMGIDPSLPYILRQPAQTFLSEAIAIMMERLPYETNLLAPIFPQSFKKRKETCQKMIPIKLFWTMTVIQFEYELYRDPEQDLNKKWWEIVYETQRIHPPLNWDAPYWASKPHLTTLPVYYQHYLLGDIAAYQLQHHLVQRHGTEVCEHYFETIKKHLFQWGTSKPWKEIYRDFCHEDLNASYLINSLSS